MLKHLPCGKLTCISLLKLCSFFGAHAAWARERLITVFVQLFCCVSFSFQENGALLCNLHPSRWLIFLTVIRESVSLSYVKTHEFFLWILLKLQKNILLYFFTKISTAMLKIDETLFEHILKTEFCFSSYFVRKKELFHYLLFCKLFESSVQWWGNDGFVET